MIDPHLTPLLQRAFRYAYALCHSRQEAEDMMQEACLRIMEKKGRWEIGYLLRVIRNLFIDQKRRQKIVRFEQLDGQGVVYQLPPPDPGLDRALKQLDPNERELLYLFVVEGYTAKELSKMTNQPRGTILSKVHRTKAKLRKMLSETPTPITPQEPIQ